MGETVRIKAGTITLPEAVLKTLGLGEGDAVEIVTSETGVVELRRPGGGFKDLRGIIKLERARLTEEIIGWSSRYARRERR